jgi:hypothetical protein
MVVNIWVHKVLGNSWVAERLLACQEGVGSMDIAVNVLLSWKQEKVSVGIMALKAIRCRDKVFVLFIVVHLTHF